MGDDFVGSDGQAHLITFILGPIRNDGMRRRAFCNSRADMDYLVSIDVRPELSFVHVHVISGT